MTSYNVPYANELMALGVQAYLAEKIAELASGGGGGGGYQSLELAGAVPDGDDLADPTDNYDVILNALNTGGMWSGGGKTYAVAGGIMPTNPALSALVDCTLVQLTPEDPDIRTLWLYRMAPGFLLRRVYVRRHKDNVDARRLGVAEWTAGIRIEECDDVTLEGTKVEGDGLGVLLHVLNCHGVTHVSSTVRNANYSADTDTGLEYCVGAIHSGCTKIRTFNVEAGNITSQIATIEGGIPLPYESDGWDHMRACDDVKNFGAWLYNCNEGSDNTNNVHSRHRMLQWINSFAENCAGIGFKFIYNMRDSGAFGCSARNIGICGIATFGSDLAYQTVQDFTIDNFTASMMGTMPFPRFYPTPQAACGILLAGAPHIGKGTIVQNPRCYSAPQDCEYGYFLQVAPMNYTTYRGLAYQAQYDDWAEGTSYPAGMVKSYNAWFYTSTAAHVSSTLAQGGFRGDVRKNLWRPTARTTDSTTYLLQAPTWGTYVVDLNFTGVTATGSPTITGIDSTLGFAAGMRVRGPNIPANATIVSVGTTPDPNTSTFSIVLNANATGAATSTLRLGGLVVTNGGANYGAYAALVFSPPNVPPGIRATGTGVISGGVFTDAITTNRGQGYTVPGTITATDGVPDGVTTITAPGTEYDHPALIYSDPVSGGVRATATVTADPATGSIITTFPPVVGTRGNYTSVPTVLVTDGIDKIVIDSGGINYRYPQVVIDAPNVTGGVQAVAIATLADPNVMGPVDNVSMTTFGSGYTRPGFPGGVPSASIVDRGAIAPFTGTTTVGSINITSLSINPQSPSLQPGLHIEGPGIPPGTTVASRTATVIALSQAAAAGAGTGTFTVGGSGATCHVSSVLGTGATAAISGWTIGSGAVITMTAVSPDQRSQARDSANILWTFMGPDTQCQKMNGAIQVAPVETPGDLTVKDLQARGYTQQLITGSYQNANTSFWWTPNTSVPVTGSVLTSQGSLLPPTWAGGLGGTTTFLGPISIPRSNLLLLNTGLNSNLVLPSTAQITLNFASGVTPGAVSINSIQRRFNPNGSVLDGDKITMLWVGNPQVVTVIDAANVVDPLTANNRIFAGNGGADRVMNAGGRRFKMSLQYSGALNGWTIDWLANL